MWGRMVEVTSAEEEVATCRVEEQRKLMDNNETWTVRKPKIGQALDGFPGFSEDPRI